MIINKKPQIIFLKKTQDKEEIMIIIYYDFIDNLFQKKTKSYFILYWSYK